MRSDQLSGGVTHVTHESFLHLPAVAPPYSGLGPAYAEVCFMHDDRYEWRLYF